MGAITDYNRYVLPKLAAACMRRLFSTRFLVVLRERLSVVIQLDYGPSEILLSADSLMELNGRRLSCAKEPETVRWIETYVKPGDVVYDVGANVGAYSLVIDRHTGGRATVYAFEPGVPTFGQLSKNVYLNSCQKRIIPLCVALSNCTELSAFHYTTLMPGAAGHALGTPVDYRGRAFGALSEQPVLSYRLDDLIGVFNLKPPSHIKLDVDGIEWEILQGADATLRRPELRTIWVEINPKGERPCQIRDYLHSCGFRRETLRVQSTTGRHASNELFVRGDG